MNAMLDISIVHPEPWLDAAYGALIRVRPESGRMVERCLPLKGSERVEVQAGEVTVDTMLSSGRTLTQTVHVSEGEVRAVAIQVPRSPHEAMVWLSLARDPSGRAVERSAPQRSQIAKASAGKLESFTPRARVAADIIVGHHQGPVRVVTDEDYAEGRILHVLDDRSLGVLQTASDSGLALLRLREASLPYVVRVCALPGPWTWGEPLREVHVALRQVDGDALPDVQIVIANAEFAAVVGFLERSDQRALSLLHERFADQAVNYMAMKRENPIAAAVGLALLLRLGDLKRVKGWSGNLWRWFPGLPDSGALHAAVLLRGPRDTQEWRAELREAALGAATCGMPLLTDSLRYLREALAVLVDIDDTDPLALRCARWCDRLMRAVDVDAVFTTATLAVEDFTIVWGEPR